MLCVEWDAREKILATGGHDGQVRLWDPKTGQPLGQPLLGHSKWITSMAFEPLHLVSEKSLTPRIATASKDSTVRIWNTSTRKLEFVLTGHAASVNVVRWGGENVIYTGSSDRTVKVWSGVDVSVSTNSEAAQQADCQGKLIRTLSEHAHWVNTMALSTDFVLRTGPYDHTGKVAKDDTEGELAASISQSELTRSESACSRSIPQRRGHATRVDHHRVGRPHPLLVARSSVFVLFCDGDAEEATGADDRTPEAGQPRRFLARWTSSRQCGIRQCRQDLGGQDGQVSA